MENTIYIFNEKRNLIYVSTDKKNCSIALLDILKISINADQVLKIAKNNGLIIIQELVGVSTYQLSFSNLYRVGIDGFKDEDFQYSFVK